MTWRWADTKSTSTGTLAPTAPAVSRSSRTEFALTARAPDAGCQAPFDLVVRKRTRG